MWEKLNRHLRNGDLFAVAANRVRKTLMRRRGSTGSVGDTYYGDKAATYLEQRLSQPSWEAEQNAVRGLLAGLPDGISVLDVPFGTGRFVPYYLEKGMTVAGLDASADMLSAAQRALGEDYASCDVRVGDARTLPYADDSFDLVVSFRFLQTMIGTAETPMVLGELRRVTRSHAILELKVRKEHVPKPTRTATEPMTFQLCAGEINELLNDAGFTVREVAVIGPPDSKYRDLATKHVYLCEKQH